MSASADFPTSNLRDSAKPQKRVLWKWSIALAVILLLILLWQCGSGLYSGYKSGNEAVRRFHAQLNAGKYDEICSEADEAFTQSDKHDELVHFLEQVHHKLGDAGTATQVRVNVNATMSGTFVTSEFTTQFEQGQAGKHSPGGKASAV